MSHEQQLEQIIRNEAWLMDLLRVARDCHLNDWFIAAGAIRNTVWDVLHGYQHRTPLADVDLVHFDHSTLDHKQDLAIWKRLTKSVPEQTWNVVNQARGHIMAPWKPQVHSTTASIAYWSETPTCVGARLNEDDSIDICAPHGLDDLMNLRVRPVPEPYQNLELYRERIAKKRWKETWPKLDIEDV